MEKSPRTIGVRLNHLMELNLLKRNGSKNDPNLSYEIIM